MPQFNSISLFPSMKPLYSLKKKKGSFHLLLPLGVGRFLVQISGSFVGNTGKDWHSVYKIYILDFQCSWYSQKRCIKSILFIWTCSLYDINHFKMQKSFGLLMDSPECLKTRNWTEIILINCPTCRSVQFSSVAQLCLTLCDPMNCNTPGLPVHHQLPEFTQTHVHWVCDATKPPHPLLFPSPPAFNLSQHHSLFKWVSFSHQVAKVLEFQLQHQSFRWTPRTDLL